MDPMSRYAAFLRGINVGGHRIKSAELIARFEAIGFSDVNVFLSSGNVIFIAKREPIAELTALVEADLGRSLGYEVATFLRTQGEVCKIAAHEPFAPAHVEDSKGRLQVAMLSARPAARAREEVLSLATDEDRLAFSARELYWLPSGGTVDSGLDLKKITKLLGAMTWRTKKTVERIAARYFPIP
jgi:uncharacterized protein (DUF1697 family)